MLASWVLGSWLAVATVVLGGMRLMAQSPALVGDAVGQLSTAATAAAVDPVIPDDPVARVWQQEASLRSVACVTEDQLVAVGDRGTVLRSSDAGRTWNIVQVATTVNLADVQFHGQFGLAVGGWIGRHSGTSFAVMLKSTDGGLSWQAVSAQRLPRLAGVRIFPGRIVCWGDYSLQLRSCLFESFDGGQSWHGVSNQLGLVTTAGTEAHGRLAAIDNRGQMFVEGQPPFSGSLPRNAQFNSMQALDNSWIAAGKWGQVWRAEHGGAWSPVDLGLEGQSELLCCWNCLITRGNRAWLAGAPGSIVLCSSDGGNQWTASPTGQSLPIYGLCMADDNRGWAVGAQGLVLATRDGGQSWYVLRSQPSRSALLACAPTVPAIAWSAVTATMWDQQRCTAAIALQSSANTDTVQLDAFADDATIQAARQIGVSDVLSCDSTHVPPQELQRRLAIQILSWRPDVLLISKPVANGHSTRGAAPVAQGLAAAELAGSEQFAGTVKSLNLKAWKVSKIVAETEASRAEYSQPLQQVLPDRGMAVWDVLLALPVAELKRVPATNMHTVWSGSQAHASRTQLLGGVLDSPDTRLSALSGTQGNYQLLMGRTHRQRMAKQLASTQHYPLPDQRWLADFRFFAQAQPAREADVALADMLENMGDNQQLAHGQSVLQYLAYNFPGQDISLWAHRCLLQRAASDEWVDWSDNLARSGERSYLSQGADGDQQIGSTGQHVRPPASLNQTTGKNIAANHLPVVTAVYSQDRSSSPFAQSDWPGNNASTVTSSPSSQVVPASAEQMALATVSGKQFGPERNRSYETRLAAWKYQVERSLKMYPELRFHPSVIMQMAKWHRRQGDIQAWRGTLAELAEQPVCGPWYSAATQELTIASGRTDHLECLARAARIEHPPHLDGEFSEDFWYSEITTAGSIQLLDPPGTVAAPNTEIRWAHDQEFLFIGIRCQRAKVRPVVPLASGRPYDADLSGLDRVQLLLDVDRDYSSAIELSIAENGLTGDRCLDCKAFNPKWYVCTRDAGQYWQAEVAIALSSLGAANTEPARLPCEAYWAVAASRLCPGMRTTRWPSTAMHGLLQLDSELTPARSEN
ncbi:MAG: hypothetical protein KF752_02950 [Pirellulaceae bacterium]|nr:hypothetical protein [Pirellulaceae bacterium]